LKLLNENIPVLPNTYPADPLLKTGLHGRCGNGERVVDARRDKL